MTEPCRCGGEMITDGIPRDPVDLTDMFGEGRLVLTYHCSAQNAELTPFGWPKTLQGGHTACTEAVRT